MHRVNDLLSGWPLMWDRPWKEDDETQGIWLWSEAEGGGRNNLHIVQYSCEAAHEAAAWCWSILYGLYVPHWCSIGKELFCYLTLMDYWYLWVIRFNCSIIKHFNTVKLVIVVIILENKTLFLMQGCGSIELDEDELFMRFVCGPKINTWPEMYRPLYGHSFQLSIYWFIYLSGVCNCYELHMNCLARFSTEYEWALCFFTKGNR